jgi:hypothetical protein
VFALGLGLGLGLLPHCFHPTYVALHCRITELDPAAFSNTNQMEWLYIQGEVVPVFTPWILLCHGKLHWGEWYGTRLFPAIS